MHFDDVRLGDRLAAAVLAKKGYAAGLSSSMNTWTRQLNDLLMRITWTICHPFGLRKRVMKFLMMRGLMLMKIDKTTTTMNVSSWVALKKEWLRSGTSGTLAGA